MCNWGASLPMHFTVKTISENLMTLFIHSYSGCNLIAHISVEDDMCSDMCNEVAFVKNLPPHTSKLPQIKIKSLKLIHCLSIRMATMIEEHFLVLKNIQINVECC